MHEKIAEIRKALVATVAPPLALLVGALTEASPGGVAVTPHEWALIALAGVTGGVTVWAVPNEPTGTGKHRDNQ